MESFAQTRTAKEFLVHCIVDEAQREGTPLTEVERKMLYFSETHWSLPTSTSSTRSLSGNTTQPTTSERFRSSSAPSKPGFDGTIKRRSKFGIVKLRP